MVNHSKKWSGGDSHFGAILTLRGRRLLEPPDREVCPIKENFAGRLIPGLDEPPLRESLNGLSAQGLIAPAGVPFILVTH